MERRAASLVILIRTTRVVGRSKTNVPCFRSPGERKGSSVAASRITKGWIEAQPPDKKAALDLARQTANNRSACDLPTSQSRRFSRVHETGASKILKNRT